MGAGVSSIPCERDSAPKSRCARSQPVSSPERSAMAKDGKTMDDAELVGGAHRIAEFLFGSADVQLRREVYHLAEHHDLPVFKVGNKLYARKVKLHEWIEAREQAPRR